MLLFNMLVQLTPKRGKLIVNTDKVLFAADNGKYTRIELEDGTPIDVVESVEDILSICNIKTSIEN